MKYQTVLVVVAALAGLAPSPDLAVHSVTGTNAASRSSSITISDVTTNRAALIKALPSTSSIYLTNALNITGLAALTTHNVGTINPNRSESWSGSITIPANQTTGASYVIVVCDKPPAVTESDENNNTNYYAITINP